MYILQVHPKVGLYRDGLILRWKRMGVFYSGKYEEGNNKNARIFFYQILNKYILCTG